MKFSLKPSKILAKLSFRKKITIAMIILSVLLTIYMGVSSYQLSSNIILNMSKELSEKKFDIAYESLENYFSNVERYSTLLTRQPVLRNILQIEDYDFSENKADTYYMDVPIRETLALASSKDYITFNTVNIYCKNGYNYYYYENIDFPYTDYESCIKYYTDNGYIGAGYKAPTWCDVIETYDNFGRRNFSFINFRILYDSATLEETGILLTGINESDLYRLYSNFSGMAFIMHKNGLIISHLEKSQLGYLFDNELYKKIVGSVKSMDTIEIKTDKGRQLITFRKLAGNDAYFVIPFDYYSGNEVLTTNSFSFNIIALILIGLLTSIIFAVLLSKGLSASVLALKKTVQAVHDGDLSARYISDKNDEVAYLGKRFNDMLEQINNFFIRQKEQENTKKTLELKLLQSQINPHLLYNTLDSTMWALDTGNISRAKEIINSLSNFFKISLSGGNDLIPIKKELELIQNYINIQRSARGKDITLNIKAPKELLDSNIIKLSIQPIVENSILHGFSGFRDDGIISITIQHTSDKRGIQIIVEDNGIGIQENKLKLINRMLKSYPQQTEIKHFGLYIVQRRIKNLFGANYGISFESELGNYTRVIITIPSTAQKKEDPSNDV